MPNYFDNPGVLSEQDQLMQYGANQARSNALNAGLLSLGAGLIGGPTLKEGLSKGLNGFNNAYNESITTNKPKITPLADGAYTLVTLPDGSTKMMENKPVADYQLMKWGQNEEAKKRIAAYVDSIRDVNKVTDSLSNNAGGLTSPTGPDQKYLDTTRKLDDFMSTWNDYTVDKDGNKVFNKEPSANNPNNVNIPFIGSTDSPKLAGAVDMVKGTVGTSEDFNKRKELDFFLKNEVSKTLKEMGSNPSTADLKYKVGQVPDAFNTSSKVLSKWLSDYKEAITIAEQRRQAAAQARDKNLGKNAAPLPDGTPRASSSSKLQTFASPDEVRAAVAAGKLKSGATFMDPNGVVRTVP